MIRDYSKISAPLHKLLQKDAKFDFNDECVSAFKQLKHVLSFNETLALPDFSRQFRVTCDGSFTSIGSTLSQVGADGIERPVSFYGRSLSSLEKVITRQRSKLLVSLKACANGTSI